MTQETGKSQRQDSQLRTVGHWRPLVDRGDMAPWDRSWGSGSCPVLALLLCPSQSQPFLIGSLHLEICVSGSFCGLMNDLLMN